MAGKIRTRLDQKERRREEILDAALAEFVHTGYAAARLEDIAEQVGITKGAILFHFESKEKLFQAAIQQIFHTNSAFHDETWLAPSNDPIEELTTNIRRAYRNIIDDPLHQDIFRLIISEGRRFPQLLEIYRQEFANPAKLRFGVAYLRGVEGGIFRPFEFETLCDIIFGPAFLRLVSMIITPAKEVTGKDFIDMHCEVIIRGILTPEYLSKVDGA